MNLFDLICVVLMLAFILSGYVKGLISSVFGFFSMIASLFLAWRLYPSVGKALRQTVLYDNLAAWISGTLKLEELAGDIGLDAQREALLKLTLPEFMADFLLINNNSGVYRALGVNTLDRYVSGLLAGIALNLFAMILTFIVAGALLKERPLDKLLAGVVIAGGAHFVNLVDVRPGRALGAVLALGAPGLLRGGPGGELAAVATGAAAAVLREDVGERTMLGDTGAHALGAALGAAVVAGNGRAGLLAHAVAVVTAAVYGDRVTAVAAAL